MNPKRYVREFIPELNSQEMDACVAEYEWRISAIQRMMNNASSPSSSAVSNLDASDGDDATGDVTKSGTRGAACVRSHE